MPIVPDTKDWTWVLGRACPECGFDASRVSIEDVPALVRRNAASWTAVLSRPAVAVRPDEATWSPLEYAAHVRDVYRVMLSRLELILDEDEPVFPDWDQNAAAVAGRYAEENPVRLSGEIGWAAEAFARCVELAPRASWSRSGQRGDGAPFTFASLAVYALHDVLHHAHDVSAS